MPQAVGELSKERMVEIENRIIELQVERNGQVVVCHQCFIHSFTSGGQIEAPACEIRYVSTSRPAKGENPPLLRVDVGWKCAHCHTYINNSISLESEEDLEDLIDLMEGERYDPAKAGESADVREEKLKALGYIKD